MILTPPFLCVPFFLFRFLFSFSNSVIHAFSISLSILSQKSTAFLLMWPCHVHSASSSSSSGLRPNWKILPSQTSRVVRFFFPFSFLASVPVARNDIILLESCPVVFPLSAFLSFFLFFFKKKIVIATTSLRLNMKGRTFVDVDVDVDADADEWGKSFFLMYIGFNYTDRYKKNERSCSIFWILYSFWFPSFMWLGSLFL